MEILDLLIPEDKRDYKCYDLLKEKLESDKNFQITILEGIREGKIEPFDSELLERYNEVNVRWPVKDIDEVLKLGGNIGGCTTMAYQLSFIFPGSYRCAGFLPLIEGSLRSADGTHTWLESKEGKIYDTSLMLAISKDYASKIGYNERIRERYESLQYYDSQKEFALDKSIKRTNKIPK